MFIEQKNVEYFTHDLQGRELCKRTETIYLFEGQTPNEKNSSPQVQAYYKKLFILQEEKSLEAGYPVCALSLIVPVLPEFNPTSAQQPEPIKSKTKLK